jgi:hypothetical protein
MCVLSEREEPDDQDRERDVAEIADPKIRAELSRTERDLLRRIDPGARALVIATVMLVLMLCSVLPWIGPAVGWQILTDQADPALGISILPRLFSINSTIAGILLSALALATRRWAVAWVAAMACTVVSLEGLVAIWSRQTVAQAGPSVGLVLAVVSMFVLAAVWLRVVWSRT